ncbi:alpha-amylase family glycosyl hydrolase [Novosphingobium panipatense]
MAGAPLARGGDLRIACGHVYAGRHVPGHDRPSASPCRARRYRHRADARRPVRRRAGWGYDGVLPYAPHPAYGTPDDLRALVDAAHGLGLSVLLDVVYNHFGPSGNYLGAWCPSFFHPERASPWGQGIAFETPAVREFFIDNALHWLDEYRFDGLRLDAVHAIEDHSSLHFLDELGQRIRARGYERPIHLVTEDERNLARYFAPDAPYDGTWNDDWHHAAHCLLTGEDELLCSVCSGSRRRSCDGTCRWVRRAGAGSQERRC